MLFLLFITILNFLYTYGAYDDSFARNKIFPMASAAYSGSPELCVHDNFDNSTLIRQLTVSCDAIHDTCAGFIAVSYSDNAIILSFRGASTIQVAVEVLEMLYDKEDRFPGGGNVSHYFYKAFLDIWNAGMKDDFFILKSAFPTAELWVTGHSLGASLATLAAGYIAALQYYPANQIKLVTFGQPRTGDLGYANYIDNTIAYAYRVVHQIDIVPHVPFYNLNLGQIRNYTHHKSEVWYNNDMTVSNWYTECDENESNKCSDQFEKFGIFGYDILDHLSYFNKLADYATFGCPRH